jgi:ATP-dependent RNA helicase SUPV3L1/SUV3
MSDRSTGQPAPRVVAVLGPTNTGKTHLAVERMLGHASGMIGLPLRLLAREIYDRIVRARGKASVALITGEEKIVPPRATYFVCTVEAMPLGREVEFLAIDEIQLVADPTRGHIFTDRLLHARGKYETMFLGSAAMATLIRRLVPEAEFVSRERFSTLTYSGSKKLTRLPRRTAIVAFSAERVYSIAELIRRQRGGAAVVMGSLSPRTRNAQVALYQSGEVDFLVATDAIGMGLNMDVDHVAFAGLRKFDGKRTRWLTPSEVAQVAGRAGRYTRNGTFGVTGEAEEMDEDLVASVEEHRFEPVLEAQWRTARLDFASLDRLIQSLAAPPKTPGLKLTEPALDEITLKALAGEPDIASLARAAPQLGLLWEVCQTPDFRKTTMEEHLRLTREVFERLIARPNRIAEDWMSEQFAAVDRTEGEIDVLSQRLAGVRTLAYFANRPDWLRDPAHWQAKTRALEDRLSDSLHEKLMARFIDRRTSVLLRSLGEREEVLAGVADDGAVTVEGQYVGRLVGVNFEPAAGSSALEDRALRNAAIRAVGPELAKRLGALAAAPDDGFTVEGSGSVRWRAAPAGRITGGTVFAPVVKLYGDLGPTAGRERAQRRLEAFLAAEAGRRLAPLKALDQAMADGRLKGLARGVAFRLREAGGALDRRAVAEAVRALSPKERRSLKAMGVRFAAFSVHLPGVLTPEALALALAYRRDDWAPPLDRPARLPDPLPGPGALGVRGLIAAGPFAVPVALLEQLDSHLRAAPPIAGASVLTPEALADLGWDESTAHAILKGLGFTSARKTGPGQPSLWRMRRDKQKGELVPAPSNPTSPFAALAGLTAPPARRRRPRRPIKAAS